MNKTAKIIIIFLFFFVLLAPHPIDWLAGDILDRDVSAENRNITPFPERFKWRKIASEFEEYYNDRIPFRNFLVTNCRKAESFLYPFSLSLVLPGKEGFYFYTPANTENTLLQYNGKIRMPYHEVEKNRKFLVKLHKNLKERNIKFMLVVAPNKIQIYPEYLPERRKFSPTAVQPDEMLYQSLKKKNPEVSFLMLYSTLFEAKKFYGDLLFYKADTHWSSIGGYLGAWKVITTLDPESPLPGPGKFKLIDSKQKEPNDMQNQVSHKFTSETRIELKPDVPVFKGEVKNVRRNYFITFNPAAPDPRRLLVYRDSFTNNMYPWISNAFREVHYIWTHKVSLKTIDEIKPDVVIVEYVSRILIKMKNEFYKSNW